ncbi:MAG: enolase C-terminal domain-like protein [Gemmatimonadota bacterium]
MQPIIDRILATEVVVHARAGYVDRPAFGDSIFDKASKWLLEVRTSDGLVGYGESSRGVSRADVEGSARTVLGRPLQDFPWRAQPLPDFSDNDMFGHRTPPVPHRLYERSFGTSGGMQALRVALDDLLAKQQGVPLHHLFGGACRPSVPTSWWMGRTDPEHAARQMEIGVALGFTGAKFKAAAEDDIRGSVRAIKQVAGEQATVGIDPNFRFYRLSEAVRLARQLEEFDRVLLEDPFPFDVEEWRLFRQKTSVPLALHSGPLPLALAHHCCDYANLGGAAFSFMAGAHMASHFHVLCWHGSGLELGILDAYRLHLAAATPSCVLPGDSVGPFIRADDLIEEALVVRDGAIEVPTGVGLGVTPDRKAIEKHTCSQLVLTS